MFCFEATEWLLGIGALMGLAAGLAGLIDFFGDHSIRRLTIAWYHMGGNLTIVALEGANWGRRFAGGPDVIIPGGFIMSLVAVLGMLVTGWLGWEMVYRRRVGIMEQETLVTDESLTPGKPRRAA